MEQNYVALQVDLSEAIAILMVMNNEQVRESVQVLQIPMAKLPMLMLCPRPNSVDCQLSLCLPLHSDLGHVLYLVVVSLVTRAVDPHKPVKPVCRSSVEI